MKTVIKVRVFFLVLNVFDVGKLISFIPSYQRKTFLLLQGWGEKSQSSPAKSEIVGDQMEFGFLSCSDGFGEHLLPLHVNS